MKRQFIFALSLILVSCTHHEIAHVNGKEVDIDGLYKTTPNSNMPQLTFCWSQPTIHKDHGYGVKEDSYYTDKLLPLVKDSAPFHSLEPTTKTSDYDCDVLLTSSIRLYITPMLQEKQYSISIEGTSTALPNEKAWAYAYQKESLEAAALTAGNILFKLFAPGTPIYEKLKEKSLAKKNTFEEEAKKYRELKIKPELSEEARKFKVQANAAFERKDFETADTRYSEALKLAPWWPQGHFNRALIQAELGKYRSAIEEMNKYLLLVPDAPDARAAKDKIYIWEDLAKTSK